jgi:hypothetical protein
MAMQIQQQSNHAMHIQEPLLTDELLHAMHVTYRGAAARYARALQLSTGT